MSGFLDLMGATAGALALIDRLAENPAPRAEYDDNPKGRKMKTRSYATYEVLDDVAGSNPRARKTAKRAPIKRAGIPAKKYVARPSQITRAEPSKRLKARRAAHIASGMPAGVFPNPIVTPKTVYRFVVQSAKAENGPWKTHSGYNSQAKAFEHARLIAKAEPAWWVRVQAKTEKFKGSIHG